MENLGGAEGASFQFPLCDYYSLLFQVTPTINEIYYNVLS